MIFKEGAFSQHFLELSFIVPYLGMSDDKWISYMIHLYNASDLCEISNYGCEELSIVLSWMDLFSNHHQRIKSLSVRSNIPYCTKINNVLVCKKDGLLGNMILHFIEFNREQTYTKEQKISAHSFQDNHSMIRKQAHVA